MNKPCTRPRQRSGQEPVALHAVVGEILTVQTSRRFHKVRVSCRRRPPTKRRRRRRVSPKSNCFLFYNRRTVRTSQVVAKRRSLVGTASASRLSLVDAIKRGACLILFLGGGLQRMAPGATQPRVIYDEPSDRHLVSDTRFAPVRPTTNPVEVLACVGSNMCVRVP
jgi:hypothetical protein